ncbi:MAG: glycosyltransferase [SAR324 cluster bacterium]|nr:glycosyltransferase [SAR324 cluster bacterium]
MSGWIFANLSKNWGGGEKWTLTTAKALENSGHSVFLLVYPESQLATQASLEKIPFLPINARSQSLLNPFKVWRTFRFFKESQFEAIILNSSHELKFLGPIASFAGIRKVIFRRGIPQALRSNFLNRFYFRKFVNGIILNSQTTLQAMESVFSTEMSRLQVQVIYNGLDLQLWKSTIPKQSSKIIGVVGRLSYEKGIDRALYVFAKVREQIPEAQLWIVGEGEEGARLKQISKDLDLLESIRFIGFTESVLQYMENFDVLLFPSRWEGFGYVLLEAMSLQIPPVSFDISTAREILTQECGVLVPDDQIEACAEEIVRLLENDEFRKEMGKNARIQVENRFSIAEVVKQMESFLSQ